MITNLPDKPSDEDKLASKAVPATMYLGMFSPPLSLYLTLMNLHDALPLGGADTVSPHIFLSDLDNN